MAFPANLNISYYKGDTYEFRVYPKDSSGAPYDLSSFSDENIKFTISEALGAAGLATQQNAFAEKATDGSYILCAITPEIGNELDAGTTYFYDVEIASEASPYDRIFTLLSGQISVTDQVTPPYTLGV